ncbi:MAG TPA: Ig-like domain-containing protein [Candidatus Edwardsbacteria bacterium]|nr:Ig-like domain-containing protein [Candidatus Edwardsbacteria bacterium]
MKRALILVTCSLCVLAGLLLQCGKKSNPIAPPVNTPTPPAITAAWPANSAAGLPRNTLIYVTFDRAMDKTATAAALSVTKMTGAKDWKYNILIFKPDSLFHAGDTVRFTVGTGAADVNGNALATAANYTFTCGAAADTVRPAVAGYAPTGLNVSVGATVAATMTKKLAPWADAAIKVSGATGSATLQSDSVLQFVPAGLAYNTLYTATVDTNAVDRCGNRMTPIFTWNFTTAADTVRPTVTKTEPAGGDTNVSVNAPVKVHFSEPMDTASARAALTSSPTLHYRASWSGDSVLTLAMTDTMSFHVPHQVTVGTGALDKAGNHLAASHPFTFTTARGLYVVSHGLNEVYRYKQNDLKPEGYLPSYNAATQVRMSADGAIAYVLTNSGLHFLQVHNHDNEPFFTNLRNSCYGVAVSPNGQRLAVSDTTGNRVYLIDAGTGALLDSVNTIGAAPKGMAFSANSGYLYVLCQFNNRMEIYALANFHATPTVITMPNGGEEMAIAPIGDRVFAACGTEVAVVRTSDNTVAYDITGVSNHPFGLAVSPDGQHLAVGCYDEGAVKVYALSNYAWVATVSVGAAPKGLCYSPDGKYLYVAVSGAAQVKRLVRAGSYAADTTLTTGTGPWGIAVTP